MKDDITRMAEQMALGLLVAETVVNVGVLVNRIKVDSDELRKLSDGRPVDAIVDVLHKVSVGIDRMNHSMAIMSNTMGRMGSVMPW